MRGVLRFFYVSSDFSVLLQPYLHHEGLESRKKSFKSSVFKGLLECCHLANYHFYANQQIIARKIITKCTKTIMLQHCWKILSLKTAVDNTHGPGCWFHMARSSLKPNRPMAISDRPTKRPPDRCEATWRRRVDMLSHQFAVMTQIIS